MTYKTTAKRVIQWGLETTYATDPTLDGTKGILCSNVNLAPFAGSIAARALAHANFGADIDAPVGLYRTLSLDVELAGSGAAGAAPLYGSLLRSCGLSETISSGVSAAYAPISASQESGAGYFNQDGVLHKMLGGRGTASLKFSGGALPMASFAMSGLVAAVTDTAVADVVATLKSFIPPVEVNKANTTTFTLLGYAATMESLTIDQGNQVLFRDRPNAAYVALTDRKVTGTAVIEMPTIAAKDFLTAFKARTTGALALTHGTVAGNILALAAPVVQLNGVPTYSDVNGVMHMSLPLGFKRTNGDDEFSVTFT